MKNKDATTTSVIFVLNGMCRTENIPTKVYLLIT